MTEALGLTDAKRAVRAMDPLSLDSVFAKDTLVSLISLAEEAAKRLHQRDHRVGEALDLVRETTEVCTRMADLGEGFFARPLENPPRWTRERS